VRRNQSGIMLLEALIAILIFSVGILGIVGMQASTIKASRDAKYRADASLLANELVGQMSISARDGATLQSRFQTGQADYALWATRVAAALPGALVNAPTVVVDPGLVGPPQTSSTVTVTVRWQAPNEVAANIVHSYQVIVRII